MNSIETNIDGVDHAPIAINFPNGGSQEIFKFDNGYGASVVRHSFSYGGEMGLYELAVIRFSSKSDRWKINYDTPITSDVIGYLAGTDVNDLLNEIKKL